MVLNESGEYRSCDEYRKLNNQTIMRCFQFTTSRMFHKPEKHNYLCENGSS